MSSFMPLAGVAAFRVAATETMACSRTSVGMAKAKAGASIRTSLISLGQQCRHQSNGKIQVAFSTSNSNTYSCLASLRHHHHHHHHPHQYRHYSLETKQQQQKELSLQLSHSVPTLRKANSAPIFDKSNATIRRASASASASTSTSASPTANAHLPQQQQLKLSWNEFLLLRRRRRMAGLVCSIITVLASTATGLSVATAQDLDAAAAAATGLDPFIVLALGTLSFAGIGWLLGPFVGNVIFAATARRRGVWKEFIAKDRAFLHRIRARRVDPSSASIQNPVPDYYGEKIGSVADYRRWLKDQRAFSLKRGDRVGSAMAGSVGTAAESAARSASRYLAGKKGVS